MKQNKMIIYGFVLLVFLLSLSMFYLLFLIVTPVPLSFENHVGFFLWSIIPSLIMLLALIKQRWVGFSIIFLAFLMASSSMIYEMFQSKIDGSGTLQAVLSYILIMIVSFFLALLVEGILLIFRKRKKDKRKEV